MDVVATPPSIVVVASTLVVVLPWTGVKVVVSVETTAVAVIRVVVVAWIPVDAIVEVVEIDVAVVITVTHGLGVSMHEQRVLTKAAACEVKLENKLACGSLWLVVLEVEVDVEDVEDVDFVVLDVDSEEVGVVVDEELLEVIVLRKKKCSALFPRLEAIEAAGLKGLSLRTSRFCTGASSFLL